MLPKSEVLHRWIETEPLYLDNGSRRAWIAQIIKKYANSRDSIFEIGCNAGSNLVALSSEEFRNLAGIDINPKAIAKTEERVYNFTGFVGALDEEFHFLKDSGGFDVVFSMAVLMHIHPEDRHIFKKLHEITKKYLICAEWTKGSNGYIMPIDPKDFEGFDLIRNEPIEGLPDLVGYSLYVFKKKET